MAYVSTATTTIKYATTCANQLVTMTVSGTSSGAGTIPVSVIGKDFNGTALVTNVTIALSDTGATVTGKIATALNGVSAITSLYTVGSTATTVTLTRIVPSANDTTLALTIATTLAITGTSAITTAGGTFTKLVDITSYPDLGSTPSKLDTTDMSQGAYKTSIFGLQETPDMTFECNYDEATYNTLVGLIASNYFFQLEFGVLDGKFNWQGQIRAYVTGGGVDEVRKMTVVTSCATPLTFGMN